MKSTTTYYLHHLETSAEVLLDDKYSNEYEDFNFEEAPADVQDYISQLAINLLVKEDITERSPVFAIIKRVEWSGYWHEKPFEYDSFYLTGKFQMLRQWRTVYTE